jgi:hypothetical protein
MKHAKYALIALLFIGGLKLFQVLFFHQEYRKKVMPIKKKEVLKPEQNTEVDTTTFTAPSLDTLMNEGQSGIPVENEDFAKKPVNSSGSASYPSLEDLKQNYLSIKNASLQEGRSREDVVIRYYKHEKDGDKVYSLRTLRYYLHEKPATETQGLGSNVIYYGGQVKPEDIQIVAYTLLEEGIPLKSIERSKFDWKSNAIEIGTDTLLIGAPNLSKADIQNFLF